MMDFDVSSDDTIWYPDASRMGDFSNWRQQFDDKIALYCNTDDTFESTRFKSNYGEVVWNSTFSEDGYLKINDILDNGAISPYIGSKAGWITVIVLGIVCLLAGLVFSFALRKGFRNLMARFCGNRCRDRPRMRLPQVAKTRMTVVGCFVVLALLIFGIVELYSAVRVKQAANAVACDFWRTSKGHFFGAHELSRAHLLENGIVPDWKGTVAQHQAMHELARRVNASDATNEVRRVVEAHYFDMKKQLISSMERVLSEISATSTGLILMQMLSQSWNKTAWGEPHWDTSGKSNITTCDFCSMTHHQISTYANDLTDTTYDGINLFETNLAIYLNTNSTMLHASYDTAMTGSFAILDVDFMMSKILMVWDLKVAPMLFPVIDALVALSCLLGIFGILLAIAIVVLSYFVLKARRQETAVKRQVTASWAGVYIALMVIGSAGMILSGIFFLLGSAGGDICTFMDSELFENGHWKSLPSIVWNETYTDRTNLPTILDACMKKTGDGDVAAATGLAMLLTRLEDGVARVEKELSAKVEKALNLKIKNEKTGMLKSLMTDTAGTLNTQANVRSRQFKLDNGGARVAYSTTNYTAQYLCVYPQITNPDITKVVLGCAVGGATPKVVLATDLIDYLNTGLRVYLGKHLDDAVKETGKPIGGFCLEAMPETCKDDTYIKIGKETDVRMTKPDQHPTMAWLHDNRYKLSIDDTVDMFGLLSAMLVVQENYLDLSMGSLETGTTAPGGNDWGAMWTANISQYNQLRASLDKTQCTVCNDKNASVREVYAFLQKDFVELGQFLWDNFINTNDRINRFVFNETIGTFETLLEGARDNLDDFNCQFIGTAMQNGMERGLCKVLMPSASMTGLVAILIWAVCFVGTFWAWRMYHYLRDLEFETSGAGMRFDAISVAKQPAEESVMLNECATKSGL